MIFRFRRALPLAKKITKLSKFIFSTSTKRSYKVSVLGASGGIGQPLCLLLKQNPLVTQLAIYDIAKITPGVGKDISHINTCSSCKGYVGTSQLGAALYGTDVVVIPAGLPRKPGMTRDDLFNSNANIVLNLACACARYSPCAIVCLITNPVNAMLPLLSEVFSMSGVQDKCKILGVTTLDSVRASTFVARCNNADPFCQYVPVVGGHAGATIVPLLSQSNPPVTLTDEGRDYMTKKIQEAGTEVVKAKAGGGSATLSMAYAGARFTDAVLRGLAGEENVVECAYVQSNVTKAPYFATPIILGKNGMEKNLGYGKVSKYEQKLIDKAIPILQKNIKTGIEFAKKGKSSDK